MRMTHAAVVLAAFSATPAFAQDATGNFNGGHLEIVGGIEKIDADGVGEPGIVYGVAGGFDFRSNNLVFGIEAEASDSSTDACDGDVCIETGRDLYVGGRVGVVVSETALPYIKAGYTNARAVATVGDVSVGDEFGGLRLGAGVESSIGGRFLVKIEYRYSDYEDGLTRHQGVLGVGMRF